MKNKDSLSEFVISFFVCTACITILEGVMGMLFFPEEKLGYDAFFSPPVFGFFSVLFGGVTRSKKELGIKQVLFRRLLHLLMIEAMVFGINFVCGVSFSLFESCVLALAVAMVFVTVYGVIWMNDLRSAALFNEKLKVYQNQQLCYNGSERKTNG